MPNDYDAMFANILNSLRIRYKNVPFSDKIDCMLQSRENLPDEPETALHVFELTLKSKNITMNGSVRNVSVCLIYQHVILRRVQMGS